MRLFNNMQIYFFFIQQNYFVVFIIKFANSFQFYCYNANNSFLWRAAENEMMIPNSQFSLCLRSHDDN